MQMLARATPNWVFSSVEDLLSVDGMEEMISSMVDEVGKDALDRYTPSGAASYVRSIALRLQAGHEFVRPAEVVRSGQWGDVAQLAGQVRVPRSSG